MDQTTILGLLAATCTTVAFIPQVVSILKTGNVDGISISMYSIFTSGVAFWLIYGLIINDIPMMMANAITLLLALFVLGLTIYKRWKQKKVRHADVAIIT